MKLKIKHFFDAAHQLPDTDNLVTKACANLHGHTYAVEVDIIGKDLKGGMVIDFKAIKNIIDELDHTAILTIGNPIIDSIIANNPKQKLVVFDCESTAENIAKFIHARIMDKYPDLVVTDVRVCEGYKGAERASWASLG